MPATVDKLTRIYVKALWKERERITDLIASITRPGLAKLGAVNGHRIPRKKRLKRVK